MEISFGDNLVPDLMDGGLVKIETTTVYGGEGRAGRRRRRRRGSTFHVYFGDGTTSDQVGSLGHNGNEWV